LAESIQAVITQTLCKKVGGGRVAALEIMVGTAPVRHLIREGKVHQLPSAMQTGKKDGMETMDAALTALVGRGLITREVAQGKSENPNLFGPTAATA
jgi:twitching motility protein PilT